ncbi:DUF6588 family protein [Saccharicrinis sp. 156]|uniref:DUF6588 family protein n=1 Tax=Saccharicrinis sp. 156 TaxID=3417574 RepID=UPI003D3350E4
MKKTFLLLVVALLSLNTFAQSDMAKLLEAGVKDANTLAKPYLEPYGEMLGSSLNNGWYNSAKQHKLLGFDVTITATYIKAPSSATTFDIGKYSDKLETYELSDPNVSITPTVAGEMDERPVLKPQGLPGGTPADFTMPNGTGMDYLPIPMVTAGVGLPFGFELKGRFTPEVTIGDAGSLGLWGIGIQKDLKDYIPAVKHVPVLNVSVLAAYTSFSSEIEVEEAASDGRLDISASGITTRLIVGANLPVVAFYGGVGYGKSTSNFNLMGTYNVGISQETDPIKLGYATNSFDANVGMRIRLGVIALHADYTLGEYSAITAGLGISFR